MDDLSFSLSILCMLATLGLRCFVQAFSSCRAWKLLSVAVQGLLTSVDSVAADHRLLVYRL